MNILVPEDGNIAYQGNPGSTCCRGFGLDRDGSGTMGRLQDILTMTGDGEKGE